MFFLTTLASLGVLFYAFDGFTIVKEKYNRFRELNRLVETRYKNTCTILWVSLVMVAKMYWMNFLQWSNNSIEHVDNKTAIVSYVLNGKLYRFVAKQKKGPSEIILVSDEDGEDVSDDVLPFYGPNRDWNGQELSPLFWKKESLTFELAIGEPKTFKNQETIILK